MAKFKRMKADVEPRWATMMRTRWDDGRVHGVDGSMWLYRAAPLGPVDDARTGDDAARVAMPIMSALEEVSHLTPPIRITRRATAKSAFRHVHIILVNLPRRFEPLPESDLRQYHSTMFPNHEVDSRVLLIGVRLQPRLQETGLGEQIRSVAETLAVGASPTEDFARDNTDVAAALTRAGLVVPTEEQFRWAGAWWNQGNQPDVPYLPHMDHMHIFQTAEAAKTAARMEESGVDCATWETAPGTHSVSFSTAAEFDLPYIDGSSDKARWASHLTSAGVRAISIRGKVEPSYITRDELRRMRKNYRDDEMERLASSKMSRAELEETQAALGEVEDYYAKGGPASLIESSTVIASTGRHRTRGYDPTQMGRQASLTLYPMHDVQEAALTETMLASPVRSSAHIRDLPSQTLALSGLPSLSIVGDRDGALVGFTERDRQPAYISPMAAADQDSIPVAMVPGQSGSGKSMLMAWLSDQFARTRTSLGERTPVVVIDPSPDSDLSEVLLQSGGQRHSLDELVEADGVFDPIRFSAEAASGVQMAHSMLMSVNPWGQFEKSRWETPLLKGLDYGVSQGASCTLQALEISSAEGVVPDEMVDAVRSVADASPMFRALCGSDPSGTALRAAEGVTYIRVGSAHLDLPSPGTPLSEQSLQQRVAMALVRAMTYGSMQALSKREGVLMLDEAWTFTSAGRTEMDRIGRLARKMDVFPMLYTQRVSDALDAGLAGYISRGIILPITDPDEARAACELFRLEPTPERMQRITEPATMGGHEGGEPNWDSMRALITTDPTTMKRQVLRGAIGIYCDLSQRTVPVEVTIPQRFLDNASTNRLDQINRRHAAEAREADESGQDMAIAGSSTDLSW